MLDFFGVVEVIDYGGYGSTSFSIVPVETKEDALILLGQKMLQYPWYCILSAAVYNKNHEKVYSYEQDKASLSCEYVQKHYDEHRRMTEATESNWKKLQTIHERIDDYLYGGEELKLP